MWAPSYVKDRVAVTWEAAGADDRASALDETSGGRITIWKTILPVILEHPVLGVGYGNLEAATRLNLGVYKAGHNLYLEVAGELGIPGLLLLLWIFFGGWRAAAKLARRGGRSAVLGRSYHGVVICLLVVNVFGQRFLNYSIAGYFFLLSGLVVLEERFTRPEAAAKEEAR
jgi:putative inorganic carbon (HCO3(-)) transporter